MDPKRSKDLVQQAIQRAVVAEPNDVEWLFREGVIAAGPPYTVRLQTPDTLVTLLAHDEDAEAFDFLLTDLRQRVGSIRTVTTGELRDQLLLALARVAAGVAKPNSVEQLAQRVAAGEPVVALLELDGIEWLGEPTTLGPGVLLGRVSDALEQALSEQAGDPDFTLVADFSHPITEDFQGDRVDPPHPGDDYDGHYPVVLALSTSDRSAANNMIVLRRLATPLGGALWLFSAERGYGFSRPRIRDYAQPADREYDRQFDALLRSGGRWDDQPQDEYRLEVDGEPALLGPAGRVLRVAVRAVSEPGNALATRTLASLRATASACDQTDPYDRLLLLVVALEALVVRGKTDQVQQPFVAQIGKLTDWLFDPTDLKHLYDVRSALAHDGLLNDKQEAKLLRLTHTVALPCLSAALTKLSELHHSGTVSAADLLAWHAAEPT